MANYFQIFPPLVFSYRFFFFTNRGNFQVRTWVWRKFAAENRVNFQRGDWTGVKWSSQSRKTNILTVPDLAFGFVHKSLGTRLDQTMQAPHTHSQTWEIETITFLPAINFFYNWSMENNETKHAALRVFLLRMFFHLSFSFTLKSVWRSDKRKRNWHFVLWKFLASKNICAGDQI